MNKILKIVPFYLKPYGSTTNRKKTGIFHHFLQFTKLHSFCTHLFHWRQTLKIVDKDKQLNYLLFTFLKRYIYTNKSVFKEYHYLTFTFITLNSPISNYQAHFDSFSHIALRHVNAIWTRFLSYSELTSSWCYNNIAQVAQLLGEYFFANLIPLATIE